MAFQDFDLISQRRQQEKKQKIKRRLILAAVTFVVVVLAAAAAVCVVIYKNNQNVSTDKNHDSAAAPKPKPKPVVTAEKAVKAVCASTDYKKTCEDSLLKAVNNTASSSSPLDILRASFSAASEEVEKVTKEVAELKLDGPMMEAALEDCLVLLGDAKDELNTSLRIIRGKDLGKLPAIRPEINNWLSAVMSYQQTCIDGFPEGEEKNKVKAMLETVKELGSNSLAIVSQIASIFSGFNSQRKLMGLEEEGHPSWMEEEHHRMLKADASKFTPNATVAKDGSGNFTTVTAALNAMPEKYNGRWVI